MSCDGLMNGYNLIDKVNSFIQSIKLKASVACAP